MTNPPQTTNPVLLTLPANTTNTLSGVTNAAYRQQVNVINEADGSVLCVFMGSGENGQPMKTADGKTQVVFSPPADMPIGLLFLYQTAIGNPWLNAEVFQLQNGPTPNGGWLVQFGT